MSQMEYGFTALLAIVNKSLVSHANCQCKYRMTRWSVTAQIVLHLLVTCAHTHARKLVCKSSYLASTQRVSLLKVLFFAKDNLGSSVC